MEAGLESVEYFNLAGGIVATGDTRDEGVS
jgi:hypothetical protein